MKIHEYQAKVLFGEYGIPTTRDIMVKTSPDAYNAARILGLPVILKAQVHAGGRGKAGGVKLARRLDNVVPLAEEILGLTIKDLPVRKLLVGSAVDIRSEHYLSVLIDRGVSKVVFIGCAEGGMEIEETAKTCPGKILRFEVPAARLSELTEAECLPFATDLMTDPAPAAETARIMVAMAKMLKQRDCSLIEINPLVVDESGSVIALDGKVVLDDNALFRHPETAELRDVEAEDPDETAAREGNLTFVRLDGDIGCMVNGAGLAMATMDIVKHFGGSPANFLDAGGSSDPNKVVAGFKLILQDPRVKVIFINIFGGITRCDDIAKGILAARDQFEMRVPIVIRLVGTNEQEGCALIAGTEMICANTLEEGAKMAVAISQKAVAGKELAQAGQVA